MPSAGRRHVDLRPKSGSSPFGHPLSIPNRLRDADAQGNPNDLSDKPSTEPGQLQTHRSCRALARRGPSTYGSPQPTPTSSQRKTSGRAGWKRLGPVVTMRSRSLGRRVSECWFWAASVMRRLFLNRSEPAKKSGQNIPKNRCRTTVAEPIGKTRAELPFIGDQVAAPPIRLPVTREPRPAIRQSIQQSSTDVAPDIGARPIGTRPPLHPQKKSWRFCMANI